MFPVFAKITEIQKAGMQYVVTLHLRKKQSSNLFLNVVVSNILFKWS